MFSDILSWLVIALPVALGVLPFLIPQKEANPLMRKEWKIFFAFIAVAYSGIVLWQQKLTSEAAIRDRNTAIQETGKLYKVTIDNLNSRIQGLESQLTEQGENVEVIKRSNIVTGKNPVKVEVTNPSSQSKPQLPILAHIRIASQKQIVSTKDKLPYALEVVVQTDQIIEPVAFIFECDGEIGEGFGSVGANMYFMSKSGSVRDHPNWFLLAWKSPPFTPQTPMIVKLFSKKPIQVINLRKIEFEW